MKDKTKNKIVSILGTIGISSLLTRKFPSDARLILTYHKVDKKLLDSHITWLKKRFQIVPLNLLLKGSGPFVSITFDDGYQNNAESAYPILKKHGIHATVFLTTGFINTNKTTWWDRLDSIFQTKWPEHYRGEYYFYLINWLKTRPLDEINEFVDKLFERNNYKPHNIPLFMTWKTVKKMQDFFSYGAHTHTHPILPTLTDALALKDIKKSISEIKKNLDKTPHLFAYPNGSYNDKIVNLVKKSDFSMAVTTNTGINEPTDNPLTLKRINVKATDDVNWLASKIALARCFK